MVTTLASPTQAFVPGSHVERVCDDSIDLAPWLIDRRLDIAVDTGATPVVFRLSGTLDATTGTNLEAVLRSLIDEGYRQILIDVDDLEVDVPGGGGTVLAALDRLVAGSGRRASSGAPVRSSCPQLWNPVRRTPKMRRSSPAAASPSSGSRAKEACRPRVLAGTGR